MKDPYSILGVSKNATDEEVKNAYRELARKYHPDNYQDNPLADLASEKMQEINEAYDEIINNRRRKGDYYEGDFSGGNTSTNFPEVRSLISQNRLEQALEVLDGVPIQSRNAEWYFLNGTVQYRRGWFDQAYTSFATACRMEPSNTEYRNAFNHAQRRAGGGGYNPYRTYGGGANTCDCCQTLICADCCCEMCGGNLIPCLGCR